MNLIKNATNHLLFLENIKKYLKCPALNLFSIIMMAQLLICNDQ